ncbi:MAG: protease modulator HflK, partial [Burkholderiaceae bacterium]|nr:protease modulator HflK [Burkholderiaceae bacterium]
PEQVKAAFDDVLSAAQERERKKNQAQAYANRVVPQASGDKASVIAHAQGETQRFSAVLAEYEKAPQVTRDRLYIDTLRGVYANTPKVLMDGHAGNLIYLPLDKVLQASGAKSSSAASAQSDAGASPAQPAAPALDSNGMAFDARSRDNLRNRDREAR